MLIDTPEKLDSTLVDLLSCTNPCVDVETNGLNPWGTNLKEANRIIGIAIDVKREAYYFPFRHKAGINLPVRCLEFFRSYLSDPHRTYGGHNFKFDQHMLYADDTSYALNYEDSMLAIHLLNENEESFGLKELGDKYGIGDGSLQESILQERVVEACKSQGIRVSIDKRDKDFWKGKMWVLPPKDVEPYACDDVRLTRGLLNIAIPALQHYGLYDIWQQINYYSYITAHMENRGLLLDTNIIRQYQEESEGHTKDALTRLYEKAGFEINPNSSKQACAFLEVNSSAAEVLEDLIAMGGEDAEKAKLIQESRGWMSVNSRYYTPYMESIDKNNTLHCSLNLMGTISGRLSCSNPNLQAVAKTTDIFKVKDVFIARKGYTLISADYSQAEMRLACFYAKEEGMADLIRNGEDIHGSTAETLGIPRDAAKRINFGVIYGIGAEALHKQLRIDKKTAQGYLNKYHKLYPNFRKLLYACEAQAERDGFIRLWTGRMRHYNTHRADPHKAMSNLIQGGVAEIMRVTISKLFPAILDLKGYMLLQVHDQVIFEVPDEVLEIALPTIERIMEDFDFDPKMTVDIKHGKSWGTMQKWEGLTNWM